MSYKNGVVIQKVQNLLTNHNLLTYIKSQQNLSRRQTRWLQYVEQIFHYRWEYCHERNNVVDSLNMKPIDEKWIILALLTRSSSSRNFQSVVADTGRSAPMQMTNTGKTPLDPTMNSLISSLQGIFQTRRLRTTKLVFKLPFGGAKM